MAFRGAAGRAGPTLLVFLVGGVSLGIVRKMGDRAGTRKQRKPGVCGCGWGGGWGWPHPARSFEPPSCGESVCFLQNSVSAKKIRGDGGMVVSRGPTLPTSSPPSIPISMASGHKHYSTSGYLRLWLGLRLGLRLWLALRFTEAGGTSLPFFCRGKKIVLLAELFDAKEKQWRDYTTKTCGTKKTVQTKTRH